jgi:ABC-2 type transport system ATP-binding protein
MPPESAISIRGVTKRFREKTAVDALDLDVPAGSLCGFLGPNGAGKTTTIRMVMSIFYPDEGQISVLGKASATDSKDLIGYLPEERGVYRKMKVGEFLSYIGTLKGVPRRVLSRRIDEWLERVALPDVRHKKCEELSKGMQQKAQFVATIIHDPRLIILDEPFSGLDPVNARLMRELIHDLHGQGKTIIFSTHVLHSAEQICDRIFMINRGKKILDGSVEEIREQFDPRTVVIEPASGPLDADAVARLEGVHSVSTRPDSLEAHLADDADPQSVITGIVGIGAVRRVEVRRASLEDIFIGLVEPGDSEDEVRAALSEQAPLAGAAT